MPSQNATATSRRDGTANPPGVPGRSLRTVKEQGSRTLRVVLLAEQPEPDDADGDEVDGDDVVEEPRHHQDQNAGEKRDDGLQVADADGHGSLLGSWRHVFPSPERERGRGEGPVAGHKGGLRRVRPSLTRSRLRRDSTSPIRERLASPRSSRNPPPRALRRAAR